MVHLFMRRFDDLKNSYNVLKTVNYDAIAADEIYHHIYNGKVVMEVIDRIINLYILAFENFCKLISEKISDFEQK